MRRLSSSMFCASRLTPVIASCSRLISPAACASADNVWMNDGVLSRSSCRRSRSAKVFIFFSSELAPDQYLLVGIFNGTSVIAFPLLSHVVTLRSPDCRRVVCISLCGQANDRIIDHGRDVFQPHVAGARPSSAR